MITISEISEELKEIVRRYNIKTLDTVYHLDNDQDIMKELTIIGAHTIISISNYADKLDTHNTTGKDATGPSQAH